MEKISLPQLIAELSDHSALYNQWYKESEMKYGTIPSQTLANWIVEVVEPIVEATIALNSASEKVHEIVKALYLETLKLIGSGLAIRYEDEYKVAWLLMAKMPNLVVKFPIKTILLLNDVLLNLHRYAPEKTSYWCKLIESNTVEIKTIEDFKIVGRIYAWKCGLAHIRTRLKADYAALSENLQHTILQNLGSDKTAYDLFENPWSNSNTKFEGVQGGFVGNTGYFEHPPRLAQIGEHVFVSDSKSSYALFADQFGKVLLPANAVDAAYIVSKAKQLDTSEKWIEKVNAEMDTSTISSVVATKDTLFFTLQNSYFLYVYSLGNA
ncbi:hypothetical protein KBJ98_03400 [Flavobacterium sp. F-328]|uniref:Uncharacterized protein n=1 Tax=Flavobacterium erciyesense TaxID=2825842 RepID=A0ABS5D164_9FLAO|nr:hypothetical protein [Flavobacterium erciyesense]MBQ0907745.1 hypothetical protein [Flavobacterium erciyesense]